MLSENRYILNAFLALVVVGLIIPFNAMAQPLDKEEPSDHILNCQRPLGYHLSYKEFTCPLGGEKFKSLVLGTHSTFGRHLDWEPVSYMEFPAPLAVCPSNGFVILKENYTDAELEKFGSVIASDEYQRVFAEKHASYYYFFRLNQMLKENSNEQWWYLVEATWEAEQCNDSEKYQLYAKEAIKAGKLFLEKNKAKEQDYWILNIIIPNLYRRVGEFQSAHAWLDAFGDQLPEEQETKEFFELAFQLLRQAVAAKDTTKIPIEKPKNAKQ